jgi:hypothetical protein
MGSTKNDCITPGIKKNLVNIKGIYTSSAETEMIQKLKAF